MKCEQACRFNTRDVGFNFPAKSEGFTARNAENWGNVFNASLNQCFDGLGKSFYELRSSREDVFLARLTLRTDSEGREALFTNAAVFSMDAYASCLQKSPAWFLSLPLEKLRKNAAAEERLEALEIPEPGEAVLWETCELEAVSFDSSREKYGLAEVSLPALREKYGLTETAYARLVRLAYEAIRSHVSICLFVENEEDAAERAFAYAALAAAALPADYRKMLTVASGADSQCTIWVQTAGNRGAGTPGAKAVVFDTEPQAGGRILSGMELVASRGEMDDILDLLARDLAAMDEKRREEFLAGLSEEARGLSDAPGAELSLELFLSMYIKQKKDDNYILKIYCITLLLEFMGEKTENRAKVNAAVSEMLLSLREYKVAPSAGILRELIERAQEPQGEGLYETLLLVLEAATMKTKAALAREYVERLDMPRQVRLLQMLAQGNPQVWDPEFTGKMFVWTCLRDVPALAGEVFAHFGGNGEEILHQVLSGKMAWEGNFSQGLAGGPARGLAREPGADKLFNACETEYLRLAMRRWNAPVRKELLTNGEEEFFIAHFEELPPDVQEALAGYFCQANLQGNQDTWELARKLDRFSGSPALHERVFAHMGSSPEGRAALDQYITGRELRGCRNLEELIACTQRANHFLTPNSYFETETRRLWLAFAGNSFPGSFVEGQKWRRWQEGLLERARLSEETKKAIRKALDARLLQAVSLQELLGSRERLAQCAALLPEEGQWLENEFLKKYALATLLLRWQMNPELWRKLHALMRDVVERGDMRTYPLRELAPELRGCKFPETLLFAREDRELFAQAMREEAIAYLRRKNVLAIDPLLFKCYGRASDFEYDMREFKELLQDLTARGALNEATVIRAEDSSYLTGMHANPRVVEELCRAIDRNAPEPLLLLRDTLQPEKARKARKEESFPPLPENVRKAESLPQSPEMVREAESLPRSPEEPDAPQNRKENIFKNIFQKIKNKR